MKAEHFGVSEPAQQATAVRAPEGVSGIEDELQAVAAGDLGQPLYITGRPP